ncbi:hypothetical protein G4B88_010190, partial [Cannabis sativa]
MNHRLNLDIPQNKTFLLPQDKLAATDHLIGMKFAMGILDDINHLKNKRVRSVADLLQDRFGLPGSFRKYDRTNPLTQIVHGRKLSYLGPRGLTRRTASFRIRDIHPSHYRLICPIDTSKGINVGLIGSLSIHARIGPWGSLESPFYEISGRSKKVRMFYLSPSRDEYYMVAAGNSLALNRGSQEDPVVPARYHQEFLTIEWEQVALDSGVPAIAEHEGRIVYTDTAKIILSGNGDTLSIPLVRYQRSNKNTCMHQKPQVARGKCIKKGQILADGAATVGGELSLGNNVLVAYMPWEGYNFEDAVLINERLVYGDIYTSFHIQKYEIQTHVTSHRPERITNEIPHLEAHLLRNLDKKGVVMLGSWVETGDILVGKLMPQMAKESSYAPEDRLSRAILGIQISTSKETCLKLPIGSRGRVIDVRWIQKKGGSSYNPETIRVYISQKCEIKVGDKVAGRHGNKGIVSKNLPRQDMPYLQDGRPIDMVFNPLGVPSRMNHPLMTDMKKRLGDSKLYEASKQTANPWVFEPEYPSKSRIFDGRTGDPFEQPVIIGKQYILKLIHQVDDKIHGRCSGHYALVTQQPLRGRTKQGGQRVGQMEIWALEGFGVAHILQEMLTYKSDHIRARQEVLGAIREQLADFDLKIIIDYSLAEWKELGEEGPTGELVMCQEKLVQEAVDTLLDNGIRGQPMGDAHNKAFSHCRRSFTFITSMWIAARDSIELFQTFVICGLIRQHFASNIGVAKSKIREKEPVVWEILQEVMQGHPVFLNRAHTLHGLGIQAFQPILVEGHAICLHPLVCKGFTADFDGDQMAVHVPLSLEAQAEASLLMCSHTNLLSPATRDPISVPTQDMLIGLYVLMSSNHR